MQSIRTKEDADGIAEDVISVHDVYFSDSARVSWVDFWDFLEERGYDMGESLITPAMDRIKAIVREHRRGE